MGTRSSARHRRLTPGCGTETGGEAWELSKPQVRELRRRVRDLEDRTRYLLVSVFTPRMALYYNVSNDTFGMNNPSLGTLFKQRSRSSGCCERAFRSSSVGRIATTGSLRVLCLDSTQARACCLSVAAAVRVALDMPEISRFLGIVIGIFFNEHGPPQLLGNWELGGASHSRESSHRSDP